MFSFRQKIFITYLVVFLIFIGLIFPFASHTVKKIVTKAMQERATELIIKVRSAKDDEELVERVKIEKSQIFFRVSVISDESKILYDSHTRRLFGEEFDQDYVIDHPEVRQAFERGMGYHEEYSKLLEQKFAYIAIAFDFHGKNYVLRTAFPYQYVVEMTRDFEMGFLSLSVAVLLLFSIMTWFIINHLTRPIRQITTAVNSYQEGDRITIPKIQLRGGNRADEFGRLASTLNTLSAKVKDQIESLTSERNEKEAVLASLMEGVIAVDQNMLITYANAMALKFLGISKQNIEDQNFSVFEQNRCYKMLIDCIRERRVITDKLQIKHAKEMIYLDVVAAPTRDQTGAILVLQDKTSDYKMLQMRKDFVANASHELKTPITIIQGFAETLHDNPELPKELSQDITHKIVRNCERMTVLIKDLLTLTDIERIPEARLSECDLKEMVEQCKETVQQVYPDAKITVQADPGEDYTLVGHENLLEMALLNIIENAAKYSEGPAHIAISLKRIGDKIELQIEDHGIGIPKRDLEHIFERFYTVNKMESRKKGGSGLGLSIVQTIIHKHQGTITADSKVGEGTVFTILL